MRPTLLLLIVLLIVSLAVAGLGVWQLGAALHAERSRAAEAKGRAEQALTPVPETGPDVAEMEQRLTEATSRAVAAEARYQEEMRTHEPLRRQIETMMARQLQTAADLAQKEQIVADLTRSLDRSQATVNSLTESNLNLVAAAEALKEEKQKWAQTQMELQAQWNVAREQAAAFSNELARARASLQSLEGRSAAAEERAAGLSRDLAAVQTLLRQAESRIAEQSNRIAALEADR